MPNPSIVPPSNYYNNIYSSQETQKYKDNTEDRKMRFEALKKKDEGSSRLIAKQMKRLKKLQVSNEDLTVYAYC